MTLSEKLYYLRHKQGFTQEVLAEKLGCSRQVISKWENGTTTPDAEMLQKYSELFGVSVDYLLNEDMEEPEGTNPIGKRTQSKALLQICGFVTSLLGCASLIVFGVISLFHSETADKIAQSSMIVMDGTFIALLGSMLLVVLGALMLIRNIKRK